MRLRALWLFAALFVLDARGIAPTRADIPPPPGYVEPCSLDKVQKKGEYCTICSASHSQHARCVELFRDDKLAWSRRCRTRGASVWTEIWCAPWSGKNSPKLPQPKPKAQPQENKILPPVF